MGAARVRGTLAYFKSNTWSNLQKRTVNGATPHPSNKSYLEKGIRLEVSKAEFYAFCDENAALISGLYQAGETPSIDRVNSEGHYNALNMRIISFDENRRLSTGNAENRKRFVQAATEAKWKPCVLIHPNGSRTDHISITSAAKAFGLRVGNLSQVLHGTKKSHRGFRIKLKE